MSNARFSHVAPILSRLYTGAYSPKGLLSSPSMDIVNPSTGTTFTSMSTDTDDHVVEKLVRARKAQKDWKKKTLAERREVVYSFSSALSKAKDEIAQMITIEMGKPISQSKMEVAATSSRAKWFASNVEKALDGFVLSSSDALEERVSYEPIGVVACISPWNYPLIVGTNVMLPALLTGNAVLYKPSELSTMTGLFMTKLLHECGVPKDILIPIVGSGEVGEKLLKEYKVTIDTKAPKSVHVDGVFFTGSLATGKKVAESAGKLPIKAQLELGGKDAMYVCEDADVSSSVKTLSDGAFSNMGQACCSVERIYVHKAVASEFVERFLGRVKEYQVGDPMDPKTFIGPLARPQQAQLLAKQVTDAVSKGADLLCGGSTIKIKSLDGVFFQPTVLLHCNGSMQVMHEESFGPIVGIQVVESDDEAVELMNEGVYGLTSGVFSTSR
eukprot:TRINITY_DN6052_c0_g1_i5.p1 TRINITY_DN6052_c0_g1~~TRINITY_DN6052_c0_g1_i5.p1  ORF type:complete len:442 (-),score=99.14 TRINITY_DN6052_c0_g1_i5:623-1948(-)